MVHYLHKVLVRNIFGWFLAITAGLAAGIWGGKAVLQRLPASVAVVQGSSMLPTFESGSRIYFMPKSGSLKRGDIVLVQDGEGGCAVKRIIALPREVVRLWRGYVFINGQMLREPYLPKYTFTHPDQKNNRMAFALGSGCYFVMGDNRLCSLDSRSYGPVLADQIVSIVAQSCGPSPEFAPFAFPVHGRQTIQGLSPQSDAPKIALGR